MTNTILGIAKEIEFRTRKGALAWARDFELKTRDLCTTGGSFLLAVRRDRESNAFRGGSWVLEVPERAIDRFTREYGNLPTVVNQ